MTQVIQGVLLAAFAISTAGCVFRHVEVQPVKPSDQISIVGPAKAHLKDGSTVVYAPGVRVSVAGQTLQGTGIRYDHTLTQSMPVESVPLEMVVGMEAFGAKVNLPATLVASYFGVGALIAGLFAVLLLAAGG